MRTARRASWLFSKALLVVLAGTGSRARADAPGLPKLHLVYEITGRGEACPDEAAFRRNVALRLGYDPFVPGDRPATRRLTVTVKETPPRSVTVTLLDDKGKVLGRRVVGEPPPACEELVANAAFAASVAIDPSVMTRPAPPAETPAAPPEPAPAAPSPPTTKASALVPSLRVGAATSFGVLPSTAFGLTFGGSLRRGALSAGLEGRFDLPAESERTFSGAPADRLTLRASLIAGGVHACGHFGARAVVPYACAVVFAGALRAASTGIAAPKEDVSAYVAAGPRLGAALALSETVALDVRVEVPFPLAAVELRVDDRKVWTSPEAAAVVGAGVTLALP